MLFLYVLLDRVFSFAKSSDANRYRKIHRFTT